MKTKEIRECVTSEGEKLIEISFYAKHKSKEVFELCYLDSEDIKILKKVLR